MFDVVELIKTVGYLGIFGIVFAESGLMVGFFFPGDSLLFTAGVLASAQFLNIWILIPLVFSAAILGDNIGYWIGRKAGEKLFDRENSFFFRRSNAEKAKQFFAEHGSRAVILARFVPVVRTFVPVVAGIGKMDYKKFFLFDLIGGVVWGIGLPLAGFLLGTSVPDIDRYLLPIIAVIIFLSLIPVIKMWWPTLWHSKTS
jgi:membrane-associated protein